MTQVLPRPQSRGGLEERALSSSAARAAPGWGYKFQGRYAGGKSLVEVGGEWNEDKDFCGDSDFGYSGGCWWGALVFLSHCSEIHIEVKKISLLSIHRL